MPVADVNKPLTNRFYFKVNLDIKSFPSSSPTLTLGIKGSKDAFKKR